MRRIAEMLYGGSKAQVVELVDTLSSGGSALWAWKFESSPGHQNPCYTLHKHFSNCPGGGIGRHAVFRWQCPMGVEVRVFSWAPIQQKSQTSIVWLFCIRLFYISFVVCFISVFQCYFSFLVKDDGKSWQMSHTFGGLFLISGNPACVA